MLSRKEKEKKVLEFLNLKVGDKVKIAGLLSNGIYQIVEKVENYELKNLDNNRIPRNVSLLVINDYEKVCKVGDTLCSDYESCVFCPLRVIHCQCESSLTLFENLKNIEKQDAEIYKVAFDRLNKEVEING